MVQSQPPKMENCFLKLKTGQILLVIKEMNKQNIMFYLSNWQFIFGIKCYIVSSVDKC